MPNTRQQRPINGRKLPWPRIPIVSLTAAGLVEDGQLEERIQPCMALFVETRWHPYLEAAATLQRSMSPHYDGD